MYGLGAYAYLYIKLFNLAIYNYNRPFYEFIIIDIAKKRVYFSQIR